MLAARLRDDLIHLGSVRCRGGRDALRERRRFETAVTQIAPADFGLPPQALLIVRRVAPAVPLGIGDLHRPFTEALKAELLRRLQNACRPWLRNVGAAAEAVLFLDEAELAACLIRDWLPGHYLDRWWWRELVGSQSVVEWLKRHVIARGEVLAAVTALLADRSVATSWYAGIQSQTISLARTALEAAFGISATSDRSAPTETHPIEDRRRVASRHMQPQLGRAASSLRTLFCLVPEVSSSKLNVEQRCLLAVALAVRRDLVWARSAEFVHALSTLGERDVVDLEGRLDSAVSEAPLHRPSRPPPAETRRVDHGSASPPAAEVVSQRVAAAGAVENEMGSTAEPEHRSQVNVASPASFAEPHVPASARLESRTQADRPTSEPLPARDAFQPVRAVSGVAPQIADLIEPLPSPRAEPPLPLPVAVPTAFGGIFYLLNVALSLGLYGDFTQPRHRGLDLSPWDWLAAIGRRWFGPGFRKDPVWRLLAELAGHPPRRRPERGFKAPKKVDLWFAEMSEQMVTRLMGALGTDDPRQVPNRVCRHHAHIYKSASQLDVHLSLDGLPIEMRIAGLDRDPGWIPAAGYTVRFHFE